MRVWHCCMSVPFPCHDRHVAHLIWRTAREGGPLSETEAWAHPGGVRVCGMRLHGVTVQQACLGMNEDTVC